MRRLMVNLDNTLDSWLDGQINQNETIRKALYLYKGDITTDTIEGMRMAFQQLAKNMQDLEQRFSEQYDLVERLTNKIEELTYR